MKNKLICIFMLVSAWALAQQDIKLVNNAGISIEMIPYKFAFEHGGNYFFQYLYFENKMHFGEVQIQKIGLFALNKDLKEVHKFELLGKVEKEAIISTFFSDSKSYVLASHKQDKLTVVNLYVYDEKGKMISDREVFKTSFKKKLKIYSSSDATKTAIVADIDSDLKNESCRLEVLVLDQHGVELWNKAIDMPVNAKEYDYNNLYLSNEGDLYVFVEKKLQDKKMSYNLYAIDKLNVRYIAVNHKEALGALSIYETKNGLFLAGFNRLAKERQFRCPFLLKIDKTTTSITVPFEAMKQELIQPLIDKEFYYEKYAWSNMMILIHGWQNENGEHRVIFQPKIPSSTGGKYPTSIDLLEHIYYYTFSPDFKLIGIKLIPMSIAEDPASFTKYFYSFVNNDDLYMMYYEYENNINLAGLEFYKKRGDDVSIIRKISHDGKLKDIRLTKDLKNQYPLSNATAFTKNKDVIFFSGQNGLFTGKNFVNGLFNLDLFNK